ncbi:MAG: phage baseplate assembly protein [Tagaea sp.]|nr:phage baseplate assembly protein [Tagaea sp.]
MSVIGALHARVSAMIGRCLLRAIASEAGGFRRVRVQTRAGSLRDGVEQFEPYGLSAAPHPSDDPQGVVAELGGMSGLPVVVVVHCAGPRPRDLEPGEVALYSRFGQLIKMDADGNVTLTAPGKIEIAALGEARLRSATRTVVECNGHGSAILPDKVDAWTIGAVAGSSNPIAAPRLP